MEKDSQTFEIPLETVPNFRCVVQSKKLYRSSRQDRISPEDCEKIEQLGVRTILDLRSEAEYLGAPGDKLYDQDSEIHSVQIPKDGSGVACWPVTTKLIQGPKNVKESKNRKRFIINYLGSNIIRKMLKKLTFVQIVKLLLLWITDFVFGSKYAPQFVAKTLVNPAGLAQGYIDILEMSKTEICTALQLLSRPENLPALVSCAIGKDRTGLTIALVLSVLGKSDDYICEEYSLSEKGLKKIKGKVLQSLSIQFNWCMDESFASARKETMEKVLEHLQKTYGTVSNYLESIGFSVEDQARLKKAMLDEKDPGY